MYNPMITGKVAIHYCPKEFRLRSQPHMESPICDILVRPNIQDRKCSVGGSSTR